MKTGMDRKRKIYGVLAALLAVSMLSACGSSEETHVIEKETESSSATQAETSESTTAADAEETTEASVQENGYCFVYNGTEICVDEDMEEVLLAIGEANSYYEAPSCAFENEIDKTYTYSSFQIMTYPTDGKDWVSYILLQDDTVETKEGIRIGSSYDDVTAVYGEDYTEDGSMIVYKKDEMKLCFVIDDDNKVSSIQYLSTVLD